MTKMMSLYTNRWRECINKTESISGRGRNNLRNYCTFKTEYIAEHYCKILLAPKHRSSLGKFRCGVAPIRIETGSYEHLVGYERLCQLCNLKAVESEVHVLMHCNRYAILRQPLLDRDYTVNPNVINLNDTAKLCFDLTDPNMCRISANACFNILNSRMFYLCK